MVKLSKTITCNFDKLSNKELLEFEIVILDLLIEKIDTKNNRKIDFYILDKIHDQILEEMDKRGLLAN